MVYSPTGSYWKIESVFDPRLHDLQLLELEILHFVFLVFYGELIPSSLLN